MIGEIKAMTDQGFWNLRVKVPVSEKSNEDSAGLRGRV